VEKSVSYHLWKMKALTFLRCLPSESVDLILTDPPYSSLEKHRAQGTTTRLTHSKSSSNDWFPVIDDATFGEYFVEFFRVLKRNRHLYVMCNSETMWDYVPQGRAAGFKYWKDLIWDKVNIGTGWHYRNKTERVLFFEKGKQALNDKGVPDLIPAKKVYGGYPTEKPVELAEVFIRQSARPGDVVCDPFMGSGTTGVAALRHGCHFWGNDIKHKALQLSARRLGNLVFDLAVGR
jgi:site-specific DNA-methyltransferase (adenine-specific)